MFQMKVVQEHLPCGLTQTQKWQSVPWRISLMLVGAFVVAGCTAPQPPSAIPASKEQAADHWHSPLPPEEGQVELLGWWRRFNDPTLVALTGWEEEDLKTVLAERAAELPTAAAIFVSPVPALVELHSTTEGIRAAQTATNGFERVYHSLQSQYRVGMTSLFELEDARRTHIAAQRELIGLRTRQVIAWIGLYRALGGGWEIDDLKESRLDTPMA